MKEHKFQIGQVVFFTSRPIGHMASNSTYRVVKLLPSDGDDYQYRIKSAREPHDRVVGESQLVRPVSQAKRSPPRGAKRRLKPSPKRAPARPRAARASTRKRG